jgi:putative hydroxymethylpyrimidine transport system permease protein
MAVVDRHFGRSTPAGRALPAALFALTLTVWQIAVRVTDTPPLLLPAPTDIGAAFLADWQSLLGATAVTGLTAATGLAVGLLVGLALAFVMVQTRRVAVVLLQYVVALRIAPIVAIAPLLVVWLGDGFLVRVLLVSTMTVFPVVIATYDGLRSIPRAYLDLARSVDAPRYRIFARVRVPAALPSVFAGVKLASVLAVVGAVVAEFVTLDAGIGAQLFAASNALRTPRLFAALACLTVLGLLFYVGPALLERRVSRP